MAETAAEVAHGSVGDRPQASPAKAKLGAYSAPHRLRGIDRRTTLGKHIRDFERGLIEHVGGSPALPVRALIDQAVGLELQIKLLERAGIRTDHDRRCYAAWLNAKRLTLRELGLRAPPPPKQTLQDYLLSKRAAAAPPLSPPEIA